MTLAATYNEGAFRGLEKFAFKFKIEKDDGRPGWQKALPWAAGIGIPAATIGGLMLSKPGIRATLKNTVSRKGDLQQQDAASEIPSNALATADRIGEVLKQRGVDPATLRFAVDAPPGTGKTTLSRAISQQLGMKHYGLDWLPNNAVNTALGGGHIETMPRPPRAGEILEHFNLLRAYDPEVFDAVLHIKKDPALIKQQIIRRGRGAYASDMLDYNLAGQVGASAFDTLAGDPIDLGGGALMKLRPREGWDQQRLDKMLEEKGMSPADMSRHEKLLSLVKGQRTSGSGWTPYLQSPLSNTETALALGSIPLGILAAKAVSSLTR